MVSRYPLPTRVTWTETGLGATSASTLSATLSLRYSEVEWQAIRHRDGLHTAGLRERVAEPPDLEAGVLAW